MRRLRDLPTDDHNIVIMGLRRTLDGSRLMWAAAELQPDVIVTAVTRSQLNGIEGTRQTRKDYPKARFVFRTMQPDAVHVAEALDAGALGYVPESAARELPVTTIREALWPARKTGDFQCARL